MTLRSYIYLFLLFAIVSCRKKEVGPQCIDCSQDVTLPSSKVLVGCEGNFGWGNASLSVLDPTDGSAENNAYQNINGVNLGDVFQSMEIIDGNIWMVINNSGKIEICDSSTLQNISGISGLTSPRYVKKVTPNKVYCTDLYSNSIAIIDANSKQIMGSIPTDTWTEGIFVKNDRAYVSCPDTNWVLVIDIINDQISDTLMLTEGPGTIVQDINENLWVLCSGGFENEIPMLYQIDPVSHVINQSFAFQSIQDSPVSLRIDASKSRLFYKNGDVFEHGINENSLSSNPIINANGSLFYGFNVDPSNSNLYLTDAVDYVQSGFVYRFDSLYQPLDTFNVGLIPQSLLFLP